MRLGVLSVFFLCSVNVFAADDILFDVILFGKKIGRMTMSKFESGDTVHYVLQGRSKAKILWMEYDDVSRYEVKYKGGKMLYCKYKEDMNGKLKYFTEIIYNGTEYIATTKSVTKKIVPEAYPSLLSLYYKEPVGVSKIYFEAQMMTTPLVTTKPGQYVFKNNEGHNNTYIYQNGALQELVFETALATVRMKRAE
jgi:hypothetical protein